MQYFKITLLVTVILCFASADCLAYDFVVNGIFYNILSSTTVEVTYESTDYCSYSGYVSVPDVVTHDGQTYSVTGIGGNAFRDCEDLTSITLGTKLTSIDSNAFRNCEGMTSITIPAHVTSIGNRAFYGCTNLSSVTNLAITPQSITSTTFSQYGSLYVLAGCKNAYSQSDCWSIFSTIREDAEPLSIEKSKTISQSDNTTIQITKTYKEGYTVVTLSHSENSPIYYSFSGNTETEWMGLYQSPLELHEPCTITFTSNAVDFTYMKIAVCGIPVVKDTIAHFTANEEAWFANVKIYDSEMGEQELPSNWDAKAAYYFGKTAWSSQQGVKYVYSTIDTQWRMRTQGQVLIGETNAATSTGVGNGAVGYYAETPFDAIGAPSKGRVTFGGKTSGEPFTGSVESTVKFGGELDIVTYSANNNTASASILELQTSTDGETWTTVSTLSSAETQRYFKKARFHISATEPIYIRVAHVGGGSNGLLYDIIVIKTDGKSNPDIMDESLYSLSYNVNGALFRQNFLESGGYLPDLPNPTKTGYTFTGWENIPVVMPNNNVAVNAMFSINRYAIRYYVDQYLYAIDSLDYASTIIPHSIPMGGDYTTSDWRGFPENMLMPAQNFGVHLFSVQYQQNHARVWYFDDWSAETLTNLESDIKWTGDEKSNGTIYEGCYWCNAASVAEGCDTDSNLMANGAVIKELYGLKIKTMRMNQIAIATDYRVTKDPNAWGPYHGTQYLWFAGAFEIRIPNVNPGSIVHAGVESHKLSEARGIDMYINDVRIPWISGQLGYPTTYDDYTWQVPENIDANAVDVIFRRSNGCHVYYITIDTDMSIPAPAISIGDGDALYFPLTHTYETVNYSRTFSSADKWQAFYVPFSIPVETLAENGLEVA